LLQLERTSGVQISEMVEQKDRALQKLQVKQMGEMDAMVGSLAGGGASCAGTVIWLGSAGRPKSASQRPIRASASN
jgi:hypothetical protein